MFHKKHSQIGSTKDIFIRIYFNYPNFKGPSYPCETKKVNFGCIVLVGHLMLVIQKLYRIEFIIPFDWSFKLIADC